MVACEYNKVVGGGDAADGDGAGGHGVGDGANGDSSGDDGASVGGNGDGVGGNGDSGGGNGDGDGDNGASGGGDDDTVTVKHGLPPIADTDARVLILGSFPSVASLRAREYYAHPRNQFWSVMEALFAVARTDDYAARCRQLTAQKIAVWDVIKSCRRAGSLDARIRDAAANDFAAFHRRHPRITAVCFNGAAAEQHYLRLVGVGHGDTAGVHGDGDGDGVSITTVRLPSTSPANAATSIKDKIKQWRTVTAAMK